MFKPASFAVAPSENSRYFCFKSTVPQFVNSEPRNRRFAFALSISTAGRLTVTFVPKRTVPAYED